MPSSTEEFLTKHKWSVTTFLTVILIPTGTYVGNTILEAEQLKGKVKATEEYRLQENELKTEYNEVLRDAITYRALYDQCCSEDGG